MIRRSGSCPPRRPRLSPPEFPAIAPDGENPSMPDSFRPKIGNPLAEHAISAPNLEAGFGFGPSCCPDGRRRAFFLRVMEISVLTGERRVAYTRRMIANPANLETGPIRFRTVLAANRE